MHLYNLLNGKSKCNNAVICLITFFYINSFIVTSSCIAVKLNYLTFNNDAYYYNIVHSNKRKSFIRNKKT